jgi:hypothetical protein
MRRTKAAQIYKKTGNLRAVQLLLVIRSSKAQFATSASRSMTRSASRSRSSCELRRTRSGAAILRGRGFPRAHQRPLPSKRRAVHHHGHKPRGWVDSCPSLEAGRTARLRRFRSLAVPGWNRDARPSRGVCRRAGSSGFGRSAPDRGKAGGGLTSTRRAAASRLSGRRCRNPR